MSRISGSSFYTISYFQFSPVKINEKYAFLKNYIYFKVSSLYISTISKYDHLLTISSNETKTIYVRHFKQTEFQKLDWNCLRWTELIFSKHNCIQGVKFALKSSKYLIGSLKVTFRTKVRIYRPSAWIFDIFQKLTKLTKIIFDSKFQIV